MVVAKESFIEWEPHVRDLTQERILKNNEKPIDPVQEEQKYNKSVLRKVAELIKEKDSLIYAIIVNTLILIGSIVVISLLIIIGGFLMNPFLIISVLLFVLLLTVMKVLKLAEKETNCKKSS